MTTNVNWIQAPHPIRLDVAPRATAPWIASLPPFTDTPLDHTMARDVSREVARIRAELAIQRSGERLTSLKRGRPVSLVKCQDRSNLHKWIHGCE